jgi:hypothetical protein
MRPHAWLAVAVCAAAALLVAPAATADPPAVSITSGPSGVVASSSASFGLSVDDPDATVECSLDGGGFSGCSSSVSYSGLSDGSHTFTVRATNASSETGSDSRSWTVDTTGPALQLANHVESVNAVTPPVPVTYTAGATDPHGPVAVSCTPPSGSSFPYGATTVSCTATDGLGNSSSGSFTVTVQDVTAPVLTTPGNVTRSVNGVLSAVVTFTVTADEGTPTCSPASGSSFPLGATTVVCTATDVSGNTGSASFTVAVSDTTPPTLTLPGTITRTVNAAAGAVVTFTATAADGPTPLTPTCTPPSGSTFPLGTTSVTCSATDAAGNTASGSFTVVVSDVTAPTVAITSGPTGTVGSSSATFSFTTNEGTFTCSLDGEAFGGCSSPATVTGLADGSHTFRVRATDLAGNVATAARTWSVDTTPPTITTPGTFTVEANGPTGSVVSYAVSAADGGAPLPPASIACTPASGSLFPLGTRVVRCEAADELGNVGAAEFDVVVADTTPPTLIVADITLAATSARGIRREDTAMAKYLRSLRATDLVTVQPVVTTTAPDVFPVGTTQLTVTATDGAGNSAVQTVTVTVLPPGAPAPPPPDLEAPGDVRAARAAAGDRRVTLSWTSPATSDLAAVEVRMSVAGTSGDRIVYRGRREELVVRGLVNDVQHRFVVTAIDTAGNRSRGVVLLATPHTTLLAAPRPGARLARPPLLRWVPVAGASYFNVQLYRGTTKVLSAWPTVARLQLQRTWRYDGKKRALAPGRYTWYVWPGLGSRTEARYGPLLGKSTFTVVKPKPPV